MCVTFIHLLSRTNFWFLDMEVCRHLWRSCANDS